FPPRRSHGLGALTHGGSAIGVVFGGQLTARRAERGDVVEQPILRFGREISQQAFCAPRGWLLVVKPVAAQCGWPVVTQIDGYRAAFCRGRRAEDRKSTRLNSSH